MSELLKLAERVEALTAEDNAIDVLCEIALFEPDDEATSVKANAAGTKVVYTYKDGSQATYWAEIWTHEERRGETAAALRARAILSEQAHDPSKGARHDG